ncbi:Protein-export membrane protein SecF [Sulfidibacter corallicola]|uniref:Protein-export membrane protein SecF n=1 Tax=Sulfidibacter corallicola TaxID=2818388 RepID=A0A8A4TW40_SULCO|nr:protein translocase subunit SecF [Sulfidibacter corallicola]QTD53354.1 protein translocase subunit SecF [Sulfidibacter corallicola]
MKHIEFMKQRQKFGLVSVVVFVTSLIILSTIGLEKSVDFEGGTKLTVNFAESDIAIGDLRDRVNQVDSKATIVRMEAESGSSFQIKIKNPTVEEGKEAEASLARLRGLEKGFGTFNNEEAERIALIQKTAEPVLANRLLRDNPYNIVGTDDEKKAAYDAVAAKIKQSLDGVGDVEALAAKIETDAERQGKLSQALILQYPALNRTTNDLLNALLTDANPLNRAAPASYGDVTAQIIDFREKHGDFAPAFGELSAALTLPSGEDKAALDSFFANNFILGHYKVVSNETFSPSIASELLLDAIEAIILALIAILIYIAVRFRLGYAVASVVALVHDVIIALGAFAVAGLVLGSELSNPVVAAFLTIVGYSLNDTIVVFDRIRENLNTAKTDDVESHMNKSINQTLSRTIVTSLTTFFVVAVIYWGSNNATLRDFALPLLIGIVVGTYSSIFVASPVLLLWHDRYKPINK